MLSNILKPSLKTMKNFNLTLALIPNSEKSKLHLNVNLEDLNDQESNSWLHKKSLSTKAIKNYKCVIDCIFKIISDNLSTTERSSIKLSEGFFCIDQTNAEKILNITSDFTNQYKLAIQKELSSLIYIYELKTTSEILKEIGNHIKTLNDYLKLSNENFCLVVFCTHNEMAMY